MNYVEAVDDSYGLFLLVDRNKSDIFREQSDEDASLASHLCGGTVCIASHQSQQQILSPARPLSCFEPLEGTSEGPSW